MIVKVSAKSARQIFHGCEPGYIRDVCKGACCRSSSGPILVTLLPREEAAQRALGLRVSDGLLEPAARRCPHQEAGSNLCGIHGDGEPFGCVASPFMLTARDTLIVRNRYRLLRCFKDGVLPAYRAFATSLELLFGPVEAARIAAHLDGGGGDLPAAMLDSSYDALRYGDAKKKQVAAQGR